MKLAVRPSLILWLSVLFYLDGRLLLPFFLSAGLHELGHIYALRRMGRPPAGMTLSFAGAELETAALSYRQELWAAATGPAVSLLLGAALPVWPALGYYSLVLAFLNLLPIPGLDGGRILLCALLLHLREDAARRIARTAAMITALAIWGMALYLAIPMGFGLWPLLLAALLLYKALSME